MFSERFQIVFLDTLMVQLYTLDCTYLEIGILREYDLMCKYRNKQ